MHCLEVLAQALKVRVRKTKSCTPKTNRNRCFRHVNVGTNASGHWVHAPPIWWSGRPMLVHYYTTTSRVAMLVLELVAPVEIELLKWFELRLG